MNIIDDKTLILEEGRHFTIPGLLRYLNANYKHKIPLPDKYSFNINDVHQYVNKKKLPSYIGKIRVIRYDHLLMGLTFVELIDLEEQEKLEYGY